MKGEKKNDKSTFKGPMEYYVQAKGKKKLPFRVHRTCLYHHIDLCMIFNKD